MTFIPFAHSLLYSNIKFTCGVVHKAVNDSALKRQLLPIMEETAWRHDLKVKTRRVHHLLYTMYNQIHWGIQANRGKLNHLVFLYTQEFDAMRFEAIKSGKKDKNAAQLVRSLTLIEKQCPFELFKRYIYRCKILHSMAWFQWRLNFAPKIARNKVDQYDKLILELFEAKG